MTDTAPSPSPSPTISVLMAAYQSERWIGPALDAILAQTRPAHEIIVVDDGSTDGTAAILARYAPRVRTIRQANRGCPAAFNVAVAAASGDVVALCGSDDLWVPEKLAWQAEAIAAHPEADLFFGHAELFGRVDAQHARPPGTGVLDHDAFTAALFRENCVCAPTVAVRRARMAELGPFWEDFGADDYEYWLRLLRAGSRCYYDPRVLVRWRQHDTNLSGRLAWMDDCCAAVLRRYAPDVPDRRTVDERMAPLLFRIARRHVDAGRPGEARAVFRELLGHARGAGAGRTVRALAWLAVLGLPQRPRERLGRGLVGLSRALDGDRHEAPA